MKSTDVIKAFVSSRSAKAGNTSTDGHTLYLHGNAIAQRSIHGDYSVTLAGWPTVTTKRKLNQLLNELYGSSWGIYTKKGITYLENRPLNFRIAMSPVESYLIMDKGKYL